MKEYVLANNMEVVKGLIGAKINLNAVEEGETALTWALEAKNLDMACLLLEHGGKSSNSRVLSDAFVDAVSARHIKLVTLLTKVPDININNVGKDGHTALICAINNHDNDMFMRFLNMPGINVNAQDLKGMTALIHASYNGHVAVVERLLKDPSIKIAIQDNDGNTALTAAVRQGHVVVDIAKKLLDFIDVNVNARDNNHNTALDLFLQSDTQDEKTLELFLQRRAATTEVLSPEQIVTALASLIRSGNNSAIQHAIDLRYNLFDVLTLAAKRCEVAVVKALLQQYPSSGFNVVLDFIEKDDTSAARVIIAGGIDVNIKDKEGNTMLMWAACYGNAAVTEDLLKVKGIDVNAKGTWNITALTWAAKSGHVGVVRKLLTSPIIDVNARVAWLRSTALHLAAREGGGDVVMALLSDSRINVNMRDSLRQTAFNYFNFNSDKDAGVLELFLQKKAYVGGSAPKNMMTTALCNLARKGKVEAIKPVLSSGYYSIDDVLTPLVDEGNLAAVKAILAQDPAMGTRWLIGAIEKGEVEKVRMLLAANVKDISAKIGYFGGKTPLIIAAEKGNEEIVRSLVKYGADIDVALSMGWGHTALSIAAANDRLDLVKFMSFYIIEEYGNAAKHKLKENIEKVGIVNAAYNFLVGVHAMLVEGLSLGSPNVYLWARNKHYEELAKFLSDLGCKDIYADSKLSLLTRVSFNGNDGALGLLLKLPVIAVNNKDKHGKTALIWAAEKGRVSSVRKLLAAPGIAVTAKDKDNKTALMYAAQGGHVVIANLLASHLSANKINILNVSEKATFNLAATDIAKYLMYSGKILAGGSDKLLDYATAIEKLHKLNDSVPKYGINKGLFVFLTSIRATLASLAPAAAGADAEYSRRVSLLAARVSGVAFADDVTADYAGMPIPKVKWVSALMRSAKLMKIARNPSSYMFMHMLMFPKNTGSKFAEVSFAVRTRVLSFLTDSGFGFEIKSLPPIEQVAPAPAIPVIAVAPSDGLLGNGDEKDEQTTTIPVAEEAANQEWAVVEPVDEGSLLYTEQETLSAETEDSNSNRLDSSSPHDGDEEASSDEYELSSSRTQAIAGAFMAESVLVPEVATPAECSVGASFFNDLSVSRGQTIGGEVINEGNKLNKSNESLGKSAFKNLGSAQQAESLGQDPARAVVYISSSESEKSNHSPNNAGNI